MPTEGAYYKSKVRILNERIVKLKAEIERLRKRLASSEGLLKEVITAPVGRQCNGVLYAIADRIDSHFRDVHKAAKATEEVKTTKEADDG